MRHYHFQFLLATFFHNTVNQNSGSIFHVQALWHSITTPYAASKNNNLHQRQWMGSSFFADPNTQLPGFFYFCAIIGPCGTDSGLEDVDVKPVFSDGAILQLWAAMDDDNAQCGSVLYTDRGVGFQHWMPRRKQLLLLGLARNTYTNLKDF